MSNRPTTPRDITSRGPTLAGTKVYDADGQHVGMVSNPTQRGDDLVVELGLLAMTVAYIPAEDVERIDDTGVHLSLTHDELASGRFSPAPASDTVANAPTILPDAAIGQARPGQQQREGAAPSPDALPFTSDSDSDARTSERPLS
jgi:hypothetical protein